MPAFALTTDGRDIRHLEADLRRYLPGLDTRLEQFSPRQALLAGHLMTALRREYTAAGASDILRDLGVARARRLDDSEAVAVLRNRDVRDLAPRRQFAPAAVAGLDWHLTTTRSDLAWSLVGGPDGIDWRGIRIGQLDTGYTLHPAYGFPPAGSASTPWVDVTAARTFKLDGVGTEGPTQPAPEPGGGIDPLTGVSGGHGTKTGSTIAGRAADAAFHGVAPRCPLVPVRICDFVGITDRAAQKAFAAGVLHLIGLGDVKAINVSLGIFPGRPIGSVRRAVDAAYEAGIIMVCAAGNHTGPNVVGPANLSRTIAVAGTAADDSPWSGTSHGPEVDLSGPAADIRSAAARGNGSFGYADGGDGTSYATAMVTGAAALWHVRHRGALGHYKKWQIVEAFRSCVRSTARRPAVWNRGALGEGILDVMALLQAPLPPADSLHKDAASD